MGKTNQVAADATKPIRIVRASSPIFYTIGDVHPRLFIPYRIVRKERAAARRAWREIFGTK